MPNTFDKLVFAASGAWVMGKPTSVKFTGTQKEMNVVAEALMTTKAFVEELNNESATVESISKKLEAKHRAARDFEETMNVAWML